MLSHALTSYFSLRTEWLMNAHISPDLHGRVPHELCTLAAHPISSVHWPYTGHVLKKLCILVTVAYSIRSALAMYPLSSAHWPYTPKLCTLAMYP